MPRRCLLLALVAVALPALSQKPSAAPPPAPAAQASCQPEHDDPAQLRTDLERMRSLLQQMQQNLAFVQTSQTPLKHQFELEVEMWQITLQRMDTHVRALETAQATGCRGK